MRGNGLGRAWLCTLILRRRKGCCAVAAGPCRVGLIGGGRAGRHRCGVSGFAKRISAHQHARNTPSSDLWWRWPRVGLL